jgi:hypothetical protein
MDPSEVNALRRWREGRLAALDGALAPAKIARALTMAGLTAADIAVATGAHERTASSWLDESRPEPKKKLHQERLRDAKRVVRFVVADGTIAYQEADWFRDPNMNADLMTPLELIGQGDWKLAGRIYCEDVSVAIPKMFQGDEDGDAEASERRGVRPPTAKA